MLTRMNDLNIGQWLTGLDIPYRDFNFFYRPSGWSMAEHRHAFFQFLLVTDGSLLLNTVKHNDTLTRGMVSIIPPEYPHSLETKSGYHQFGINLTTAPDDTLIKILTSQINNPVVISLPQLLVFLPEIEDCTRLQTMVSIQKIRNRLEYMLLYCVEMLNKQDSGQAFREKLMDYFRKHLTESLVLEELSGVFNISSSHMERLCYEAFGCGVMHLFHRLKMDRARMLLQTSDMLISEIAGNLGYEDQGYFSRLFRKYAGMSPLKYRKERKN